LDSQSPPERANERRSPRPALNVFANWGAFLFGAVANFFLAPFIVNSLGNSAYGAWALLGAMVGYLGLLDLGVRGAVMRFLARLHAVENHEEASRFASAGMMVFSVSSIVAVAAGVVFSLGLDRWFDIPAELIAESRVAVVLIAMTIALALMTGVYGGIVAAMQRFDVSSGSEIGIEAVRIVAVVVALRAGGGLVALAAIQLGCGVLRFAFSYVFSRRLYPELRVAWGRWSREHLRQILGYSVASTALAGASMVVYQMDSLVIGASLPIAMVTYFAIAGTLAHYGRAVVDGISHTVPPRVSAQEGRGDLAGARMTALMGGKVATLIHLPIIVTFLLRGETFIGLWMGPEYADLAGQVLWILSISYWFLAGRQVMVTTLMGLNRHRVLIPAAWAEAILNLGLSLYWVGSYGIAGVAWGTALPSLVVTTVVYSALFGSVLAIPVARIWRELWILPSLAVLPFAVATYALERFSQPTGLALFFGQIAAVYWIAAAGAWWIACSEQERAIFRGHLPRWIRPVAATTS
jgi:O-antigen/teichoic acid export membrane protein